jgi:hypothetical protein
VARFYPDGRELSLGLGYDGTPAYRQSFDRHLLTLEQLAAIITDPQALQYFPTR